MTKTIVAVNCSPRAKWNTAQLVQAACEGAAEAGATVQYYDLYKLDAYQGCRSCFVCKTEKSRGVCPVKDGLAPVLAAIREADALVLASHNYFGRPTAGFRALFERLCFQYLTYRSDKVSCNTRSIPVLFMMTSNASEQWYGRIGYDAMIAEHTQALERFIGPVTTYMCTDTLQTDHYERYDWDIFDIPGKQARHETVFPQDLAKVRELGKALVQ